ncbi:hypothetical protein AOLI_G00258520 [Acnodon oligacanthus]
MDAPSKFFFSLKRKNGQRRCIYALWSESGALLSDAAGIRSHVAKFYREHYTSEYSEQPELEQSEALRIMECGKAPGIDGLPIEFYKSFWPMIGEDLPMTVLNDSLTKGRLPSSCRRVVLTLLAKKGDLHEFKNWRPVSLLCCDYKLLSKVLAVRVKVVMGRVIHPDQTYCVPSRLVCLDPPLGLLSSIKAALVDCFWDKLHWIQQSVLFLSKEEALGDLVDLAGPELKDVDSVAACLKIRSTQFVPQLLSKWNAALREEHVMLHPHRRQNCNDDDGMFPQLSLTPDLTQLLCLLLQCEFCAVELYLCYPVFVEWRVCGSTISRSPVLCVCLFSLTAPATVITSPPRQCDSGILGLLLRLLGSDSCY